MISEKRLQHRLIQLLACAEMVLAAKLPDEMRKQVNMEKLSVSEQATHLGEHPQVEALEILKVGCFLIEDNVQIVDKMAVQ